MRRVDLLHSFFLFALAQWCIRSEAADGALLVYLSGTSGGAGWPVAESA